MGDAHTLRHGTRYSERRGAGDGVEQRSRQGVKRGEYDSYEEGIEEWGEGIPTGGVGDPMHLGRTVAFLSSPQSEYVNGAAIPIDGGASSSNL